MFDISVYYLRRYVNSCILTVNLNIGHYIVRSWLGGLLGEGGGGGGGGGVGGGFSRGELKPF